MCDSFGINVEFSIFGDSIGGNSVKVAVPLSEERDFQIDENNFLKRTGFSYSLGASTKRDPFFPKLAEINHYAKIENISLDDSLISNFNKSAFCFDANGGSGVNFIDFPLAFIGHWSFKFFHLPLYFKEDNLHFFIFLKYVYFGIF
jgi:hypothetical protein